MDSPNLERVLRFKNNAVRGGLIEHVYMRNVKVGQVSRAAIEVDFYYEEAEKGSFTPVVRDVEVVNLEVRKMQNAWSLRGFKTPRCRMFGCATASLAKPRSQT